MTFLLVVYFFLADGSVQQKQVKHIATIEECQTEGREESVKLHKKFGKGTAAYMCIAEGN